jgi:hypothetical protein
MSASLAIMRSFQFTSRDARVKLERLSLVKPPLSN